MEAAIEYAVAKHVLDTAKPCGAFLTLWSEDDEIYYDADIETLSVEEAKQNLHGAVGEADIWSAALPSLRRPNSVERVPPSSSKPSSAQNGGWVTRVLSRGNPRTP